MHSYSDLPPRQIEARHTSADVEIMYCNNGNYEHWYVATMPATMQGVCAGCSVASQANDTRRTFESTHVLLTSHLIPARRHGSS